MRSIDKRHMGFNWDGEKPSAEEGAEPFEAIHTPTEHRWPAAHARAIWAVSRWSRCPRPPRSTRGS